MGKQTFYENIRENIFQSGTKLSRAQSSSTRQSRSAVPIPSPANASGPKNPREQKFRIFQGGSSSTGFFQIVGDAVVVCKMQFNYGPVDINVEPELAGFVAEVMKAGDVAFNPQITASIHQVSEEDLLQARSETPRAARKVIDSLINFLRSKRREEKLATLAAQDKPIKVEIVSPAEIQNPPREIVVKRDKQGNMTGAVVKDA